MPLFLMLLARAVLPALALVAVTAPAAAPPSPLALSCQGCHQPAANTTTMPALGWYTPQAIRDSLLAARDRPQPGSIMARFAAKLSDAEIRQLADELGLAEPKR